MSNSEFRIGRMSVTKVDELELNGFAATQLLPGFDPSVLAKHPDWIDSRVYERQTGLRVTPRKGMPYTSAVIFRSLRLAGSPKQVKTSRGSFWIRQVRRISRPALSCERIAREFASCPKCVRTEYRTGYPLRYPHLRKCSPSR